MTNYFPVQRFKKDKKKCYESHTDLNIGGSMITGGSCIHPFVDFDIYVGLDRNMDITEQHYPWTKGHEILFPINDGHAPSDPIEFRNLIDWLHGQMKLKKSIHIGCLGGHGRTGLVLSALYATVTKNEYAIQYVRKNYCSKAVETKEQIVFLMKHYKVKSADINTINYSTKRRRKQGAIHQPDYTSPYFGADFDF